LAIADKGHFANMLVSSRTAKEYGLTSTFASGGEGLRSINMAPGTLEKQSILTVLGTGIYISNVHYLNWSDPNSARITGMTRFACFWVENGLIQGPIQDMRFDDSIYSLFGEQLEAVTAFTEVLPETDTYDERSIGGSRVPGVLVKEMAFTL
jgi:predicted Zn-dependent protease